MDLLEKLEKTTMDARRGGGGNQRTRTTGLFLSWEDGQNTFRLAGEYLEVYSHYLAPSQERKGLCRADCFKGENRIPQTITCFNWDVDKEQFLDGVKVCPICKINDLANACCKEIYGKIRNADSEQKTELETELKKWRNTEGMTRPRMKLKWLAFSRNNPNVVIIGGDGEENEQKGIKIATFSPEAIEDIKTTFKNVGITAGPADAQEGYDLILERGRNETRVTYSVGAKMDKGSIVQRAFDEEELRLFEGAPDLKALSRTKADPTAILDALHPEYVSFLEEFDAYEDESSQTPPEASPSKTSESVEDIDDVFADLEGKKN